MTDFTCHIIPPGYGRVLSAHVDIPQDDFVLLGLHPGRCRTTTTKFIILPRGEPLTSEDEAWLRLGE